MVTHQEKDLNPRYKITQQSKEIGETHQGLKGRLTYSVTLRTWKTSCTTFTRHSLKTRSALATGSSGGTSITLFGEEEDE